MKYAINERDNMVIKDSMYNVPESLIPDRYKLILVPQKSKNKLYFDEMKTELKDAGNSKPNIALNLKNDFYGRAIVKSKYKREFNKAASFMTIGNKNQALRVQFINGKFQYYDKQNT